MIRIRLDREDISQIKKRIEKKKESLSTYVQKIEKCKKMLERSEHAAFNKTNNEKDGFNILKLRLIEYQKQRIDELNRYIFDLVEIKPKDEDMLQKSTRTALKDARQTVYVNGRWILANDHVIYRIVRSTLPTDGDYMPYYKELQLGGPKSGAGGSADDEKLMTNDDHIHFMSAGAISRGQPSSPLTLPASIPANINTNNALTIGSIDRRSILAGLTFTVQFVNLIAFYLNIVLPYNIPHKWEWFNWGRFTGCGFLNDSNLSKFSTQSLSDDQFQNAVAKLNTNIVYLSINQHIPVTNLLPKHTLENLHHFLTYFREMRVKVREK